jgi:hypothetical protein
VTTPTPPSRPDRSVSRENSTNMAEALDTLTENMAALNETMRRTAEELTAALDLSGRTGVGPDTQLAYQARARLGNKTPEITTQALGNMRNQLGITNDVTLGMTKLDPLQASTSLGHARAYAAQQLGRAIAGGPLYETGEPPAGQTTSGSSSGPPRPSGGPPAGGTSGGGGGGGGGRGGGSGGPPAGGTGSPPPSASNRSYPTNPRSATMQALGARIATSGGSTDRLMNAAKHLPVIGLGIDAAQHAGQTYLSQREKGRNYQEIEGGSNLGGQVERGHEEIYRLGQGFGMSEQAARESFYGVTNLGYNRRGDSGTTQNRQGALNFVYHNYNNRGMDVNESLGILETASQNATLSFTGLSSALKDVSDTAGKAGVNAKTMRAQFNDLLGAGLAAGAGSGATSLAQTLSSTQASYGRSFQNQSFSGALGPTETYLIGGRYGITPGQTQTLQRTQPQEYARMLTGNNSNVIQMLPGMTPEALNDLKSMIGQFGGTGTMDAQKATTIGTQWLNKWQPRNNIDLNVWVQLVNQMSGLQLDNNSVMQWVVQQVGGNTEAAHAANQPNTSKPYSFNPDASTPAKSSGGKASGEMAPSPAKTFKDLAGLTDANAGHTWWGGAATNKAGQSYYDNAMKTKTRDPVLESLIKSVKDPNNTHVQVSTKSGSRVVSFADAIKDFPNELAAGDVTFVDGPQSGRSVSDLTGGNVDTTRDTSSEMQSATGAKVGQSLSDWQKKHPDKSGGGGKVTVDLTTEAKRLLQLLPSNNNPAAASGAPPQNPYPSQASRGGN